MKKKREMKDELVEHRALIDLPDTIYIAIETPDGYKFAHWDKESNRIVLTDRVIGGGEEYRPLSPQMGKDGKKVPVGYPNEGMVNAPELSTEELFAMIKAHLRKYVDMSDDDLDLVVFFVLSTWFYRKSDTVAYLRFIGDSGKGKSRMLTTVGDLCFYPLMLGGSATRSAIMRIQEKFHGTLVLDEADFSGDKDSEMIKYLNTGFERRKVAILTNKLNPSKVELYDAFAPKIFAMREPFRDAATEGRLLSIEPYETRRVDIPPVLPPVYYDEVTELRNIIAAWTLRNWDRVSTENMEVVQELPVEPRLKQLAAPLSVILSLFGEGMNNTFIRWILQRQRKIAEQRANSAEGVVFNTIVDIAQGIITPKDLPPKFEKYTATQYDEDEDGFHEYTVLVAITTEMLKELTGMSVRRISRLLGELGFFVERKTRTVDEKKLRGRFVYVENTRRWVEAWRKYRAGEPVSEVPEIVRNPTRAYELVMEHIPEANELELKILSDEFGDRETVQCEAQDTFTMYSEALGRDVRITPGMVLVCPKELGEKLRMINKVQVLG
ncbi:MAG: hypothetical protein GXO25_08190 [Euryarchaeota archaeon]|nr:hypothetical protein [Euryarchaeota archaeon]